MISVVGVFEERAAAENAAEHIRILGFDNGSVHLLPSAHVPLATSEQPGMAEAIGGFLGGTIGVAGGLSIGAAIAALLPPAAPLLAFGYAGAAILGGTGIAAGAAAGGNLGGPLFDGLPADEIFFYEDALQQGKSVVVCMAPGEVNAAEARAIMEREGAESLDAARQEWRVGVEDATEARYHAPPAHLDPREEAFREGVEAASNPEFRGKPWDQVVYLLAERYRGWYEDAFRNGFTAGQRLWT